MKAWFSNPVFMKKMLVSILLVVFFAIVPLLQAGFAQSVVVSEHMFLKSSEWYQIIGRLKDRVLMLVETFDKRYEVRGFDENMKLKWTKELTFDHKRPKLLNITSTNKYFTITCKYPKKQNTILKAYRFDAGASLKDSILILDYERPSSFIVPEFFTAQSDDKSKLLVYYFEDQNRINAISFDLQSMQTIRHFKFFAEGIVLESDFFQGLITDKGEVFFIAATGNKKSTRKDHVYDIFMANHEADSVSLTFYSLSMEGKLTFDIIFSYDNMNNKIVAGGLYSEKTKAKSVGYFYLSVSPQNPEDYKLVFESFEDDFVSKFLGKQVNASRGLSEAVIREIILRRDGGILMIAEQATRSERQVLGSGAFGAGFGHVYFDFYYDDMFVISIHPDGKTHWKTILHKKQYSYDDDAAFSSFLLLKTPKTLSFIFNDEIKPENTVSEYVLSGNGNYDRYSILNTKNKKLKLLFRKGVQIGVNEFIIPSEYRNRFNLVYFRSGS